MELFVYEWVNHFFNIHRITLRMLKNNQIEKPCEMN